MQYKNEMEELSEVYANEEVMQTGKKESFWNRHGFLCGVLTTIICLVIVCFGVKAALNLTGQLLIIGEAGASTVKGDALLDVTDVLTETSKYDGKKIVDKMSAQQQAAVSKGGNMYAVPHYTSSYGIVYNMSLFNVNNWYFKDGYTLPANYNPDDAIADYNKYQATNINSMFIASSSDKKTAGPDGVYKTEDDGLPCTYDEFFWLCKKITQTGALQNLQRA